LCPCADDVASEMADLPALALPETKKRREENAPLI